MMAESDKGNKGKAQRHKGRRWMDGRILTLDPLNPRILLY